MKLKENTSNNLIIKNTAIWWVAKKIWELIDRGVFNLTTNIISQENMFIEYCKQNKIHIVNCGKRLAIKDNKLVHIYFGVNQEYISEVKRISVIDTDGGKLSYPYATITINKTWNYYLDKDRSLCVKDLTYSVEKEVFYKKNHISAYY